MKKNWYKLLVIITLIGSISISCQKKRDDTPEPTADVQTAQDDVYAQQAAQQTFTSVNNYGINDEGIKSRPYYITVDNDGVGIYPKTMTINFDTITTADAALKKGRQGKITATFNGGWAKYPNYPVANTSITVTFIDYKVNGIKYEGTMVITYLGLSNNNPSFKFETTDMKFTYTDGTFSKWTTSRTIEWANGFADALQSDENLNLKFILKAGSTNSGLNSKGATYTAEVKSDMVFQYCPSNMFPITQGTLDITQNGLTKSINFGGPNDVCDNKIQITISGITIDFTYRQ